MSAVLFGSISTLADTSEVQRAAFNQAFEEQGLSWHWGREEYAALLVTSGGKERIAQYARNLGESVDAMAVHQAKSRIFQERLVGDGVEARPGVIETLTDARDAGHSLGLVTTTSTDNVESLLAALRKSSSLPDFDVVVDAGQVEQPKPDAEAYRTALERLGESAEACVAVEDNVDGCRAAGAAGVECVAFPNTNTAGHDFVGVGGVLERIDLSTLSPFLPSDDPVSATSRE